MAGGGERRRGEDGGDWPPGGRTPMTSRGYYESKSVAGSSELINQLCVMS